MSKLAQCIQLLLDAEKSGDLPEIEELQKLLNQSRKPETFKVLVDLSLNLEEMIDLGKYDWKNNHIKSGNFPVKGDGKSELDTQLIHFNKHISSEDALKGLDKKGLRPATIEELLAFGAQYSEEQRKFPIVALGSSCEVYGDRYAPCLLSHGSCRNLGLDSWDGDWRESYRFLVVAK